MKAKSSGSAKKRFRKTGTGKIVAKKGSRGHLLLQKSSRAKKAADKPKIILGGHRKKIAALLPHL